MKRNLVYRDHDAEQKYLKEKRNNKVNRTIVIIYLLLLSGVIITLLTIIFGNLK